jgi:hypothetical protein
MESLAAGGVSDVIDDDDECPELVVVEPVTVTSAQSAQPSMPETEAIQLPSGAVAAADDNAPPLPKVPVRHRPPARPGSVAWIHVCTDSGAVV